MNDTINSAVNIIDASDVPTAANKTIMEETKSIVEAETKPIVTAETKSIVKRHPKKVVSQVGNFYLSKSLLPPKAKAKFLSKDQEQRLNTFFKICLPKLQEIDLGELEMEVIENFKILTGLLWGIDAQLLIYPWVDSTANCPLKKGGPLPKHQDSLKAPRQLESIC
jgi:hypothetical protein